MSILFRDDDISKFTDLTLFRKVDELFIRHNKIHTIAVEMEGIWENKGIWNYILTSPVIKVDFHGWTHKDYSKLTYEEIKDDIEKTLLELIHVPFHNQRVQGEPHV